MATILNDDVLTNVKALITRISGYEPGTKEFSRVERQIITTLKKSDSMYFLNTKDIDKAISSMGDKFRFHGFSKYADYLKIAHRKYIDTNLSESDLTPRLNVVKFLLCMSQSPTTYFWKHPDEFKALVKEPQEEVIDWGAYLNEGIERWSPTKDESFEFSASEDEDLELSGSHETDRGCVNRPVINESDDFQKYDFQKCRNQLIANTQNGWFNKDFCFIKPPSDWFDANVGILWEKYLEREVRGLIKISPISVISEYHVLREIIWQLFGPHNSVVFELIGDELRPRSNVTISSVRSIQFENFMYVFVPYIELLDQFRQFCELDIETAPRSFGGYCRGIREVVTPVLQKIVKIEDEIRKQDKMITLLELIKRLENIFKPLRILKTIHEEVVVDLNTNSPLICVLNLITRLRKSLEFSLNKLEQDIRLNLYLHSLNYYFTIINSWLVKNEFIDYKNEFVIINKNKKNLNNVCDDWRMNFFVKRGIGEFIVKDPLIRIISEDVLQIGRNLHLLKLLDKYDIISRDSETLHEKFVRRIIEELCCYYNCKNSEEVEDLKNTSSKSLVIDNPGAWSDFVEISDGFLNKVFKDLYAEENGDEIREELTLFEKISQVTSGLYPLQNLPERVFSEILKDRFRISGLMVKNLLIEDYNLDKQLEFFGHVFLFNDDLIFPFYRRLFEKMNQVNGNWGNKIWLTGHLQDLIVDCYPGFCENCTVNVEDHWRQCRDSLEACGLISLQCAIKWPLNIVITQEHMRMYKELFQFILRVKWALYTANHLAFSDLEPKRGRKSYSSSYKTMVKKLKYLRFALINVLNNVQHYIFGFVFSKWRIQFELEFEKANDLKSLIDAHENYICSIYKSVAELKEQKGERGFNGVMKCVKMLKVMWNKREHASPENLDKCYRIYKTSFAAIDSIVNPVYVFDY